MIAYLDSSFLVSLYSFDSHSAAAQKILRHAALPLVSSDLGELEFTNALRQLLYRKEMSRTDVEQAEDFFRENKSQNILSIRPVTPVAFTKALELSRTLTPTLNARSLDILHVACAVTFRSPEFYTFDRTQANVAGAVGLKVRTS